MMYATAQIKYWISSRNLMENAQLDNARVKVKYLFILEEEGYITIPQEMKKILVF